MTYQEKIKALKANTSAFGLMDKELQELAEKIQKDRSVCNIKMLYTGSEWSDMHWDTRFGYSLVIRLRSDYPEAEPEPEEIVIGIGEHTYPNGSICLTISHRTGMGIEWNYYTSAPTLIPKEGYRFAGFQTKELNYLTSEAFGYYNVCECPGLRQVYTQYFPACKPLTYVAAVYRKQ